MVVLISFVATEGMGIRVFKATKGFMYEITDIIFSVITPVNNRVYVIPYNVEDRASTDLGPTDINEFLAMCEVNIERIQSYHFTEPAVTKFISMAQAASGNAFICAVSVIGKLKKASTTELIMEWFRHGR